MNASAEQLFGVSRNQARRRKLSELLPEFSSLDDLIGRARRDRESVRAGPELFGPSPGTDEHSGGLQGIVSRSIPRALKHWP